MNKEQSFEDSLRHSQLVPDKPKKKQQQQQQSQRADDTDVLNYFNQPKPAIKEVPKVADGKLDFLFNGSRDINAAKPYHEDGNEIMYSQENLTKRRLLKQDSDIRKSITEFMSHYQFINDKLVRDQYLKTHLRLALILRDDIGDDIDEMRDLLLQDWDHDSKGSGCLKKEDLFNSLFELVDIWTPDAVKSEYVGFFQLLEEKYQQQSDEKMENIYYQILDG